MMKSLFVIASFLAFSFTATSSMLSIDFENMDEVEYTTSYDLNSFSSKFTAWGVYDKTTCPLTLLDRTVIKPEGQGLGIIRSSKTDKFFGIIDTVNNDVDVPVSMSFTFDISDFAGLSISADMASCGGYESTDYVKWSYKIDNNSSKTLFDARATNGVTSVNTWESGFTKTETNPPAIDGVAISNEFKTFSKDITETGDTLVVTLTAFTNGTAEMMAIDNIQITNVPEPASFLLLALGCVLIFKKQ